MWCYHKIWFINEVFFWCLINCQRWINFVWFFNMKDIVVVVVAAIAATCEIEAHFIWINQHIYFGNFLMTQRQMSKFNNVNYLNILAHPIHVTYVLKMRTVHIRIVKMQIHVLYLLPDYAKLILMLMIINTSLIRLLHRVYFCIRWVLRVFGVHSLLNLCKYGAHFSWQTQCEMMSLIINILMPGINENRMVWWYGIYQCSLIQWCRNLLSFAATHCRMNSSVTRREQVISVKSPKHIKQFNWQAIASFCPIHSLSTYFNLNTPSWEHHNCTSVYIAKFKIF